MAPGVSRNIVHQPALDTGVLIHEHHRVAASQVYGHHAIVHILAFFKDGLVAAASGRSNPKHDGERAIVKTDGGAVGNLKVIITAVKVVKGITRAGIAGVVCSFKDQLVEPRATTGGVG